ncbi:hypothetical protein QYE76_018001 [Lolium multiflorum]|uniref:Uncharacterized protein n=1 Tax=Lolium multiflorum TaxID=4521 RepID=A0AAD8QE47_LOLMU|nr:hypothetical protein QYE76_018001 [Lolium multiflorum]
MDQSKVISDYMIHLLVVNPAMLSVGSEVDKYVECFKYEGLGLEEEHHAVFSVLQEVWVRLLLYAAGKCRPEEHARRLSMGGEFLTLVWLAMLHRAMGDQAGLRLHPMLPGDEIQVSTSSADRVDCPLFGH